MTVDRYLGGLLLSMPVRAYQRWISPALPARCRFYPTCSSYAVQALRTRGILVGTALSCWRLLRCQPFHPGGYDPVPRRRADRTDQTTPATGATSPC